MEEGSKENKSRYIIKPLKKNTLEIKFVSEIHCYPTGNF